MSEKSTKISHQPGYDKVVEKWEATLREKYPTPEQRAEDAKKRKKAKSK